MKKRLFIIFLSAAVAMTALAGCGKKKDQNADGKEASEEKGDGEVISAEGETPEHTGNYTTMDQGAEYGYNIEGSAVTLEGKTVVVTVAVSTASQKFTSSELSTLKKSTQTALDFITTQAKEYGRQVEFVFDEKDTNLEYQYDDEIADFEYDDYDTILSGILEEQFDAAKIKDKYKADGIAYLFYLNGTGDSFSSPHWFEDDEYYFNEGAYIFKNSYDDYSEETPTGPNVIAYQLLQLFGAVALDYPDATSGYTTALMEIVNENYNNDIMLGVFEDDGSIDPTKATKEITEITAYCVGLVDSFDELDKNPTFKKEYKCSFVDNYNNNTKDGADTAAYEYAPSVDDMMIDEAGFEDFDLEDEGEDLDDEDLDEEDEEDEDADEDSGDVEEIDISDLLQQQ
ncbi:MAG: hypothetical protein IKR68_04925 [Lachnospiraceae bacterium]|nr:hypothetical protein [Lachnospiraceae bacterium]